MLTLQKPGSFFQWLQIYRLYRSAFPHSERKPFSVIVGMYRKGRSDVWAVMRDGKFAGLAVTIRGQELVLLDYFAVAQNCRGRGIGSAAMEQIQRIYAGRGLLVEIESVYEDVPDRVRRQQRKSFYLRCGLEPMKVMVELFGVRMELLGWNCRVNYEQYRAFYRDNYGAWAARNIAPARYPGADEA